MFELRKIFHFEAGHVLTHHDGKCKKPHGHSYVMTLTLQGPSLQDSGPKKNMLVDFGDIKNAVSPLIETYLDHHWLNDTLNTDSPTAEFIAQWIYQQLKPKLPLLASVSINETSSSSATYKENNI